MPDGKLWFLALTLLCTVPLLVWATECFAALLPARRPAALPASATPGVVVLVPAHNEAAGIRATLESLSSQISDTDRIVVIADNCSDDTAAIARRCGAEVIERRDPEHPGKAQAVAFGMRCLQERSPDVVIAIDADCKAHSGAVAALAAMAVRTGRPVQGSYYLEPPESGKPDRRLSALAFFVKNVVRPGGLARMGLPCFLNGSGMAFPAATLQAIDWANPGLAEDMWLTVDMALAGHVPVFCEESRITSRLPGMSTALATQRRRWLHGHLESMLLQGPRLIWGAIRRRRPALLALALDLLVPPFSLLLVLWLAGMSITAAAGLLGAGWMPAAILGASGAFAALAFAATVQRFGDRGLWHSLAAVPGYILSRIPLYAAFVVRRQRQWIPTARDSRDAADE